MSGQAIDEAGRRRNSRLEVDDPFFCKRCGKELPRMCVEKGIHPLGGDEPPEYCGSCLGEAVFGEDCIATSESDGLDTSTEVCHGAE